MTDFIRSSAALGTALEVFLYLVFGIRRSIGYLGEHRQEFLPVPLSGSLLEVVNG